MASFATLWERIEEENGGANPGHPESHLEDDLLNSGEETKSHQAIRNGLNISDSFWDDFISIIGNADAVSELLEVPKHKVMKWSSKIKELIDDVQGKDDKEDDSERDSAIETGNEGPTIDPNGLDAEGQAPADTRPM